jgi:hypothetical protein
MKNASGGLVSMLETAEERICELEDMSEETSKIKRRLKKKNWSRISQNCGATTKEVAYAFWD